MIPIMGAALSIGEKVIDRLWPDPEQRAQAKLELLKLQQEGEFKEIEVSMSAILAEAKSSDPWTSRARPSFLYVIYLVILLCVFGSIVGIWFPMEVTQAAKNLNTLLKAIPEQLWTLFGIGYLGYCGSRSFDKNSVLKVK